MSKIRGDLEHKLSTLFDYLLRMRTSIQEFKVSVVEFDAIGKVLENEDEVEHDDDDDDDE